MDRWVKEEVKGREAEHGEDREERDRHAAR